MKLSHEKAARKMLVKLTPRFNFLPHGFLFLFFIREISFVNATRSSVFQLCFEKNEPWFGLDCLKVGIYGPQNACVFCVHECKVATLSKHISHALYHTPIILQLPTSGCY
jgi:hypothetical protein